MIMKKKKINVEVTYTEGYEARFTEAVLKIWAKREKKKREKQAV